MIEFEASGWDFETREDICYALEETIKQLQEGYQSGILGNFSWDTTGEEVVYCECCNEIIEEDDTLDPDGLRCSECFKEAESDDLPTT
jgi:hypothetical protein